MVYSINGDPVSYERYMRECEDNFNAGINFIERVEDNEVVMEYVA